MLAKTSFSALTAVLLLGAAPVWAQNIESADEAKAFAERLKAVATEQGIPITYEDATISGANVTITGMRFDGPAAGASDMGAAAASSTAEPIDVTFEEVSGSAEEGFRVENVPIADFTNNEDGTNVEIKGMTLKGLTVAGTAPSTDVSAVMKLAPLYFDSASVGSVTVQEGGKQAFSLKDASVENSVEDSGAFSSAFNFGTFDIDFTTAPAEDQSVKTMRDIGYETMSGSITGEAGWDPNSGVLSLDPFDIAINDAGKLSFTYAISGYTPQFIESLKQTQAQMAANPEDSSAMGMAMMGLVSQLYLDSAVLSYEDDSLADKLLDYFAEQNGQSRADFVGGLSQMVPAMLASLNNPEFQATVESAVSTFLQDPQSLRVAIEPENPLPATQIIGAAMGAPQTLPTVLQLTVTANEAGAN